MPVCGLCACMGAREEAVTSDDVAYESFPLVQGRVRSVDLGPVETSVDASASEPSLLFTRVCVSVSVSLHGESSLCLDAQRTPGRVHACMCA